MAAIWACAAEFVGGHSGQSVGLRCTKEIVAGHVGPRGRFWPVADSLKLGLAWPRDKRPGAARPCRSIYVASVSKATCK